MFWLIAFALVGGLVGLIGLIASIVRGDFDHVEEVKYQMFHEED